MLRKLSIAIACWLSVSSGSVALDGAKFYPDLRALHDLITLDFGQMESKTNTCWALVEVVPASTFADFSGKRHQNGSVTIIEQLSGTLSQKKFDYEIITSAFANGGNSSSSVHDFSIDLYSVGGLGVCQIKKEVKENGPEKFSPFLLLPTEWRASSKPAFDYVRTHGSLFDPQDAKKNREQLEKLLEDNNPLLACFACRTLASGDQLNAKTFVQNHLAKAEYFKQAMFTYYALGALDKPGGDKMTEQLSKLIDAAQSTESLRIVSLSVVLARQLKEAPETLKIFERLKTKYSALKMSGVKADDYLELALPSPAPFGPNTGTR